MTNEPPAPSPQSLDAPAPLAVEPTAPAPLAQLGTSELTDLRLRADKYRFLFKTIVTVTVILVVATLVVVLAALLIDP